MSSEISIRVDGLSKNFPVYAKPYHRLMQMMSSRAKKHRWFREFRALSNVSFDIHKGETVGIVGRNGSGKSTLLQIICGTLAPSTGSVEVKGRVAALLELGAGFNPEFTGRENVFMNGTLLGLTRQEIAGLFDQIVAFADIGEFIEQPVKSYSSGMYVRLAFAVAIHVKPDILIVDEALSVGDEAFQRKCYARIEAIRDAGATVLFVSHSALTVLELCNKAIMLDHGEVMAVGEPKAVVTRYQKMLYAPADKVPAIRASYLAEMAKGEVLPAPQSEGAPVQTVVVPIEDDGDVYFDPGLISKSTLRFDQQGASIDDPHIETPDGRRVNVLRAGDDYVYTYTIAFQRAATMVRFGMLIKTVSGVELGGGVSSTEGNCIEIMNAGSTVRASFTFRCMLVPGTYFMNAGVMGRVGEVETYLDRVVDAASFRVSHDPGRIATGFVDFSVRPQLHWLGTTTGDL